MIIDVHNHFYHPKAYLDALQKGDCVVEGGFATSQGTYWSSMRATSTWWTAGMPTRTFRLEENRAPRHRHAGSHDDYLPRPHREKSRGIEMARASNEGFAEIVKASQGHYKGLAALPLQSPEGRSRRAHPRSKEPGAFRRNRVSPT